MRGPALDLEEWGKLVFARQTVRGGNRRPGRAVARRDQDPYAARRVACRLPDIARQAGLEPRVRRRHGPRPRAGRAGRAEAPSSGQSILALDDDPETVRLLQRALGPEGTNHQIKVVRDRVAAQLLLRRQVFDLIILALDRPDQEAFFQA